MVGSAWELTSNPNGHTVHDRHLILQRRHTAASQASQLINAAGESALGRSNGAPEICFTPAIRERRRSFATLWSTVAPRDHGAILRAMEWHQREATLFQKTARHIKIDRRDIPAVFRGICDAARKAFGTRWLRVRRICRQQIRRLPSHDQTSVFQR